jgi:hypothetical protein
VDADECQNQKTDTIFQITAMTKQAIPSQSHQRAISFSIATS